MSLCETPTQSVSPSHRFKPSLACIAEEEPRIVSVRRINVPGGATKSFQVEIPVYDVNIYHPEPPKEKMSDSCQRLLIQMEKYIKDQTNSAKYKEMAQHLRHEIALKQAESRRLSRPTFTNRDWYWYSEETKNFVDEPIRNNYKPMKEWCAKQESEDESTMSSSSESTMDEFDLNADF
ncbi:Protein CBG12535 [Caenorhabditis briggsae]|uniref:Uncharacterized protein n=2 Tax=Caenorhabditis briggsae TaxID=6238 RepID=A0AAE9E673_CAEBR|nr:Protein CBG12535 [Caenorhabditis briggsae]ULU12632.1 hypothetical protein L3Y34_015701 [Caenorhabditis briggsae]UMM13586.1 hypothetical protein L5515_001774 [Caenorhabditis briggsae]CAP31505.1 Protein CBG12535 [Caenorhabditis briggsae]